MSKRLWALGLAMTLVASAQPGFGIYMHDGARNDPAWQQEYLDLGKQYPSVVAIYGYRDGKMYNAGSAVVIGDHHVLGAAHVATEYSDCFIVTGNNLTNDYWSWHYSTGVWTNPLYTGIGSADLAIWEFSDIITSDRVAAATLYTGSDSALLGTVGHMVGFGWHGYPSVGAVANDGAKRGCQNVIDMLGYPPLGYGADQLVMPFAAPGSPNYQHLGGCGGGQDSGGGLFIAGASGPTLIAVSGWRTTVIQYDHTATGATSISQHIDWIYSVSGVPEPATAVLLGLGVIFLRRRRG